MMWPDAGEEAAGANLRLVLHRLRHALTNDLASVGAQPSPILFEHGWVALNPAYTWEIDLEDFVQLSATAGDDITALEAAAALYMGEPLEEEVYEDWAAPHREQVIRQWRQVCLRLGSLYRDEQGSPERSVEWLERLLEADPLDEEALRELLITLEGLTRGTEALRRFHRFRQLLEQELDVPPDAETIAVASRVREHLRQSQIAIDEAESQSSPEILDVVPSYSLSTLVPLVGRQEELDLLSALLDAENHGSAHVLLLAAEAGAGKTRLLGEAAVMARRQGMLTLAGGAYEHEGRLPYGPLHDALLDFILLQPEALLNAQLGQLLPELTRIVPELRGRVTGPIPDWPGDPESLRLVLFTAVARALARIAEARPLLLLLDDLHWADEGTLQLLHFLFRQSSLGRVRILATYRQEEVGVDTILAGWLDELQDDDTLRLNRLDLAPLTKAEVRTLLEERLRGSCTEELARVLHERSGGNPFFAVQMLRMLQQEGRLEQTAMGWQLADASTMETDLGTLLPARVRRTVARRLRALSRAELDSLSIGAVLGREFAYAATEALWEGEQRELFGALEGGVNAHLVGETEIGFVFRHPILREVVYEAIPRHRRTQLHRRAGLYLQKLHGSPDGGSKPQHAVQLAWHFLQADEPEQALRYVLLAADQALAAFAYAQAHAQYRTALELARRLKDRDAEHRILEQLGESLTALGRYDEARSALEHVVAELARTNDPEGQRRVLAQIGQVCLMTGAYERGLERVTRALQSLDSTTPSPGLGSLYQVRAALCFRSGRYREQLQASERAIQIARSVGDAALLVQAQLTRAYALPWLGSSEEFRVALEEVVKSADDIGDLPTLSRALCALAGAYSNVGDLCRTQETLTRALEIVERVGVPGRIAFTANMCGLAAYTRGDWGDAECHFARSLSIYRELGATPVTMVPLFGLGEVRMGRGEWDEGAAMLEEHLALAHQTGDLRWLHSAQVLLAERDLLAGHPKDALARLQPVLALPELSDIARAATLPALAWTYLELGQAGRAEATAAEGVALAEEEGAPEPIIEALRVRAMALSRQQRWDEARECLERALQLLEQTPIPYARGRVLYAYGHMLSDRDDRTAARAPLQEALEIFQRLGARPYVERTEEVLRRL
jgi:tetratricopeptide (TPR) repeat protein